MKKNLLFAGILAGIISSSPAWAGDNCEPSHKAEGKKGAALKSEIKTEASAAKDYDALYPSVAKEDLQKWIAEKKVVLIDANGTDSWSKHHIPGAINFETDQEKLASLLPADKNTLIVTYCGSPKCKAWQKAADAAQSLGYTQVRHFKDGIKGWVAAGLKTGAKTQG